MYIYCRSAIISTLDYFGGEELSSYIIIRVLTPTFLHGNKNKIELRAPSIKGVVRYWWRAAFCEEDIGLLGKEESKLFGSQKNKSPFSIRVAENKIKQGRYDILPYSRPWKNWNSEFKALVPGTNFKLLIKSKDTKVCGKVITAFELSFLLGGLGQRSRRGFGSLQILRINSKDYGVVYKSKENFLENLLSKLNKLRPSYYKIKNNSIVNTHYNESNFKYPVIKNIKIGQPESDYSKLLVRIDKATHDNADRSLGSGRPRMASPIVVRIQRISGKFYPIITELHDHRKHSNEKPKIAFIRQVLQNES